MAALIVDPIEYPDILGLAIVCLGKPIKMSFTIACLESLMDVIITSSFYNGDGFLSRLFRFLVETPTLNSFVTDKSMT